jgi:long-subunit acyl-CoA synthetase (AMP-forming)
MLIHEPIVSTPSGSNNSQPALDLSSLRALISGGESNVVDTCDKLTHLLGQYGASTYFIRPGFGMTETCAGCIYNATNCPSYDITAGAEFCSLGESIHGLQMRIVRSDGTVAEVKEVGSLEVTGSVVFRGYYNDVKATREAFTPDGWFKTGDLGLRDSGGRLRLTGRHKDTVVING